VLLGPNARRLPNREKQGIARSPFSCLTALEPSTGAAVVGGFERRRSPLAAERRSVRRSWGGLLEKKSLGWTRDRLAQAFPAHHVPVIPLALLVLLPLLLFPALKGVDLVWRVVVFVAWGGICVSLTLVALLDWSRSSKAQDGTIVHVGRRAVRICLAGVGVAGTGFGVWLLAGLLTEVVAGQEPLVFLVAGCLLGLLSVWTGVQMVFLPFRGIVSAAAAESEPLERHE
jgi:hypothetical protein